MYNHLHWYTHLTEHIIFMYTYTSVQVPIHTECILAINNHYIRIYIYVYICTCTCMYSVYLYVDTSWRHDLLRVRSQLFVNIRHKHSPVFHHTQQTTSSLSLSLSTCIPIHTYNLYIYKLYIYTHVFVYVDTYIYIHIHMYIYIYIHIYIYIYIYVCSYMHWHTFVSCWSSDPVNFL